MLQLVPPTHDRRDFGEALSIRQMVDTAVERFGPIRPGLRRRPVRRRRHDGRDAGSLSGCVRRRRDGRGSARRAAATSLRGLGAHGRRRSGPRARGLGGSGTAGRPHGLRWAWPRLSIWHGDDDRIVDPANGRLLAEQWSALHGFDPAASETVELLGMRRDRWSVSQRPVIERWSIPELAHDWPRGAAESIVDFWDIGPD